MNYTDDGKLVDANWNNRHHVTPSLFNSKNHKHYKVSEISVRCLTTFDLCSNTLAKTSRIGTTWWFTLRDSLTHMTRMKWRALVCQTIQSLQRREIFMESWDGSRISMSSSQRITTRCIQPTESSSMTPRTTTTSLTIQHWQTLSSLDRMLHQGQ